MLRSPHIIQSKRVQNRLENGCYNRSNITADDLNHAFEAGNIGPEDRIERLAQMHSVSVGDVLVDDEGAWLVMPSVIEKLTQELLEV